MAIKTGAEAMSALLGAFQESVNKYFAEIAEEMWEQKKKELLEKLDKKKSEVILQMVREISRTYSFDRIGETLRITIDETPKK